MSRKGARGVRLEALVEAENLARRCGGHRGADQRVAKTVNGNLLLELSPVPEVGRSDAPEVVLEVALRRGGATVLLVARVPSVLVRVLDLVVARHL